MSDTTVGTKKATPKFVAALQGALKDAVPSTTGGKVVAGVAGAAVAAGSFFLGRVTKKGKK